MFSDSESLNAALGLGWTDLHNPLVIALLVPVVGLAFNVISQIIILRLSGGRGFMRSIALGFLLGGFLTLSIYLLSSLRWCTVPAGGANLIDTLLEWAILIAPTYAGLGYGYANFANLGQSSIRIRLYEELRLSPHGRPVEDIRRQYNESAILKTRLTRLRESNDLVDQDARWIVGRRRFVLIGGAVFFTKQLVLQRKSEFDSPVNS